ncbi:MAG TPA: peptidase M28 [Gemmatimonas aurantiaca]|uniref:Carboxypeptidase Q n=2 Tax=Gemmatimonas aurantiaca TaxID=173480 RepID=C1ADC0_GEMAT|nr:M20/M25/M40 family metallo-hydrolase [Gemmatimonas aurantiaca]BAH40497.1 peptidase M28D family protein [Gemmatimonas aurantiaca T-27]HCT56476.1 peptidase M28 [Gemmatimonas aurantiaca]
MIRNTFLLAASAVALSASAALAQPGRGAPPGPTLPPTNPQALPVDRSAAPYVRSTPPSDATIQKIFEEGMQRSQVMKIAQTLLDSIGPRLTGSTDADRAQAWMLANYAKWGIPARIENYGTWNRWKNGAAFAELLFPRVRGLEVTAMGWSPGTAGKWVEGSVVMIPEDVVTPEQFTAWVPSARGKFVLLNAPQLSCRMPGQLAEFGTIETRDRLRQEQSALSASFNQRVLAGGGPRAIQAKLKAAGVLGALTTNFSQYPGINKVFGSPAQEVPTVDVGCEDMGLLYRLAANNQGPKIRLMVDAEKGPEREIGNVIAEMKGSTLPNEYVVLSAHFDSFTGGSGATDNGTGSLTMIEAMRILRTVYPNPKRTIVIGLWNSEEQGLNGSKAYAEMHPEVISGMQMLFNQDNGTGRISSISPGPFVHAGAFLTRYLGELPSEVTQWIRLGNTSPFGGPGGTDHTVFVCHKAPGIGTGALSWDYSNTTWHTNRDTYDKIIAEDLRNNATLIAMLAYMASEDTQKFPRDLVPQGNAQDGTPRPWPACPGPTKRAADSNR